MAPDTAARATVTDQDTYSAGVTTDAADAPAPDAPAPDDPPSGPDVGKTWGLSDEAAAVLYPDVDDAEPPQIDPDAPQVPPPFAQRPSPLLDIVRMYGSGHTDWAQAKQALIDFDYAPLPAPTGSPTGPTAGQWWADVENNAQGPEVPGSWPELVAAADHGMITQQELDEVLAARAGKGQDDGGQPAAPGPTEGKAWSEAARKAAYEARLAHLRERRVISPNPDQPPPTEQWFPDPIERDQHHYLTADGGHAEVFPDEDHEDTWYIDVTHPDDTTDDHTENDLNAAKAKAEEVLKRGPRTPRS